MTERQKFEAWLTTTGMAAARCSDSEDADYLIEQTEAAWQGWQARAELDKAP